MADHEQRAVVIGGGVAGLLAARVLSDHFAHVTVLEPGPRQAARPPHVHGLLAGGLAAFEALVPGFTLAACARGGRVIDVGDFASWSLEGVPLRGMETGLSGMLITRQALESVLRAQLSERGHVELRDARVTGLCGSAWKITGVRLEGASEQGDLSAAWVVDASGRTSGVPQMLRRFGLTPPMEERVRVELRGASCVIRRQPHHLDGKDGLVHTPCAPTPRGASVLALDDERYLVTLYGYLGAHATPSYRGMIEFARGLPDRALHTLLREAEPIGEPFEQRHPGSVRRRYDRMRHRPRGLLVLGDALCSGNPVYGHGTTLAALQAQALRRALESRGDERALQARYFGEATRAVDTPWSMVTGAELEFEGVRGTQSPPHPSVRAYFKRALRVASHDRALALAVYRVMHLIDPPSALFAPSLVSLVLGQRDVPTPTARCLKLVPDRS